MVLVLVILLLIASLAAVTGSIAGASVPREFFPLDDVDELAWIVQLSDLHVSAYHPDRSRDLVQFLPAALRTINPSIVLFTGDLTDAKNKWRTSTRQDESEWIQYKNTLELVIKKSGIDKRKVFDIRGNHDKYGVPYVGGSLDFFSKYSVSSQLNRLGTVQSISLVGQERIYFFVGMDDTISVGIRGPSNLFGHPTHERMITVESELAYWQNKSTATVTKVVFGHFPMSFTASSEKGERYENIFARQSVSAYICGHLHATFGKRLWRLHNLLVAAEPEKRNKVKQFWEWELGDWKDSRFMRILAIDRGHVSFLDFQFPKNQKSSSAFQTTILITYPPDSRSMNRIEVNGHEIQKDINVLVFSNQAILNVTAKVFDSSRAFRAVEEIPLCSVSTTKPLFHAKWNAENYKSTSAARYWLQVSVLDSQGKESRTELRPFSVEGATAHHSTPWLTFIVFDVQWEDLYAVLLWGNIICVALLLFLPKLLEYFIRRNTSYQLWVMSPSRHGKILFRVSWFMIEGSRSRSLWCAMLIYLVYLLIFPWFWGHPTSVDGDIGNMYIFGWSIQAQNWKSSLASPDIMAITLPFMYLVVAPMFLLIYSLSAEWSAACSKAKPRSLSEPISVSSRHSPELNGNALCWSLSGTGASYIVHKICRGWIRVTLLLGCLGIGLIHIKICSTLMAAYGAGEVALSPALTWAPIILMVTAVYYTVEVPEVELA